MHQEVAKKNLSKHGRSMTNHPIFRAAAGLPGLIHQTVEQRFFFPEGPQEEEEPHRLLHQGSWASLKCSSLLIHVFIT